MSYASVSYTLSYNNYIKIRRHYELSEEGQAPRQKFFLLFGKFFVEQTFAYTLNIWIYRA